MSSTAHLRVVSTPYQLVGIRPSTRELQLPHPATMSLLGTQLLGGQESVPCSHATVVTSTNTFPERFRHVLRCNPTSNQSCARPSAGGTSSSSAVATRPHTHHNGRPKPAAAAPWWPSQRSEVQPPSDTACVAAAPTSASVATPTPAATPLPPYPASASDSGSSRPGSSASVTVSARDAAAKQERERHRVELDAAWRRHASAVQQLEAETERRICAQDAAAWYAVTALEERERSTRLEMCLEESAFRVELLALSCATWRASASNAEHEMRAHVCHPPLAAIVESRELVIRDSDLLRAFRATETKLAMVLSELKLRGWVPPVGFDETSGLVPRVASAGQQCSSGGGTIGRPATLPTRPQTHAGSRRR